LLRARETIEAREYHASRTDRGLQAPNRAHALRTWFTPTGIQLQEREAGTELLGLQLNGRRPRHELAPVAAGQVSSAGARVEIARAGLLEWFENSHEGLEHGFTLAQRPAGDGDLVLELALENGSARLRGDDVVLTAETGRKLGYAHLAARDAAGRALASRFEIADTGRVRIAVADAGASYPSRSIRS
jgi:hypothetical protein